MKAVKRVNLKCSHQKENFLVFYFQRLRAGGEGGDRGWAGWTASPTWWTWVWASSRSWWWTGKSGMIQSMGSQNWLWLSNCTEAFLTGQSPHCILTDSKFERQRFQISVYSSSGSLNLGIPGWFFPLSNLLVFVSYSRIVSEQVREAWVFFCFTKLIWRDPAGSSLPSPRFEKLQSISKLHRI